MQRTEAKAKADVGDMRRTVVIRQMQENLSYTSTNGLGNQPMSNPWLSDKMFGAEFRLGDEASKQRYPATATAKSVAAGAGHRHPRALDGDLNRYVVMERQRVRATLLLLWLAGGCRVSVPATPEAAAVSVQP